jgi:hypothetical protein
MVDWQSPAEVARDGGAWLAPKYTFLFSEKPTRLKAFFSKFMHALLGLYMYAIWSIIRDTLLTVNQLGVCDFSRLRLAVYFWYEKVSVAFGRLRVA